MQEVRNRRLGRKVLTSVSAISLLVMGASSAWANEKNGVAVYRVPAESSMPTLEELSKARPMPMPGVVVSPQELKAQNAAPSQPTDPPMIIPGWDPTSGKPQPDAKPIKLKSPAANGGGEKQGAAQPMYPVPPGSFPANPVDYANYGPFQRWTHFGNYLSYPRSVIGKLFFKDPTTGLRYVCTGTVINRSTVLTAGHCVNNGAGKWYTDFVFCPSYYKGSGSGAPHPQRGCWSGRFAVAPTGWINRREWDRDYACIVMNPTGTVHNTKIGNITGWAGVSFNYSPRYLVMSFGYPAAAPFKGYHIIHVAGVQWYVLDRNSSDAAKSIYMGNDMTGGSSGGPHFINWEHATAAYSPGDNSVFTDPPASYLVPYTVPYVVGVNSHKRCLGACTTPPTATQGVFTNETGSPYFFASSTDGGDPLDVIKYCFDNGGT